MSYKTPVGTKVTGVYQPKGAMGAMSDSEMKLVKKPAMTPIIDRVAGPGTADKVKTAGTQVLSKVTGISPKTLTTPLKELSGGKYSTAGGALVYGAKKAFNKAVDVTSNILSAPARMKADASIRKSNQLLEDVQTVRKAKGVQDKGDYRDPLFRARANVNAQMPLKKK